MKSLVEVQLADGITDCRVVVALHEIGNRKSIWLSWGSLLASTCVPLGNWFLLKCTSDLWSINMQNTWHTSSILICMWIDHYILNISCICLNLCSLSQVHMVLPLVVDWWELILKGVERLHMVHITEHSNTLPACFGVCTALWFDFHSLPYTLRSGLSISNRTSLPW